MTYFEGFVLSVPTANKDAFRSEPLGQATTAHIVDARAQVDLVHAQLDEGEIDQRLGRPAHDAPTLVRAVDPVAHVS